MALVMATSALFTTATAGNKKNKKKQSAPAALSLVTPADTLSYLSGMASTDGLLPYIQKQYGVESQHLADFVKGFEEAMAKSNDPSYNAYSAGVQIAAMVQKNILPRAKAAFEGYKNTIDSAAFQKGFVAGVLNDTTVSTIEQADVYYRAQLTEAIEMKNKAYREGNKAWLTENATKEGVKTTASGLQYKVLTMGTGIVPKASDNVTVKYEGKTIDGVVFDSSYKRNPQTTDFRCDQVIKGWTEALTMMPVGSKWELYIPQELAYGDREAGKIKPYSTLIFTVELISVKKDAEPKTEEVKAAPAPKTTAKKRK